MASNGHLFIYYVYLHMYTHNIIMSAYIHRSIIYLCLHM